MITFANRRHFWGAVAPRPVIVFAVRRPSLPANDASFNARERARRPAPAWQNRSRVPQSFAEWFLTTMPVCMITFGDPEHFFRPGAPFSA
jgi:hypothetical protein